MSSLRTIITSLPAILGTSWKYLSALFGYDILHGGLFLLRQMLTTFPCLNFWHYNDYAERRLPRDLSDKVILITGASSGIGYQSAKLLSSRGAKVILGIRGTRQRLDNITQSIPGQVLAPAPLELSDFDSVREFAESLPKAGIDHLDIVLLNAGGMVEEYRTNKEGIESMLAGHHLGHAYLLDLLMPLLLRSSWKVRVVVTSSLAHIFSFPEGVRYHITKADFSPFVGYSNSKLANLLYTRALSAHLDISYPGKFKVNAVHPGFVRVPLTENMAPRFLMYNPLTAALTVLRPAFGEDDEEGDG
ncbi:Dehydrogenase/reductase SDR member 12, partial [Perkinsus chesapeaki]